jgi:fatty-acid peroxygenase
MVLKLVSASAALVRRVVARLASNGIAHDPAIDSTLAMMREGYPFIWNRCRRFESDIFTARIMGKPAVCIHGPEAARLFYDDSKLQRRGAVPRRVVASLFGKKAVHTLDDAAHRHRKAAFMSLMTPASLERLVGYTAEHWQLAIQRWEKAASVVVFDEAQAILTAAACDWVGIPLEPDEAPLRARQLGAMVDAFGGAGPRLWRGRLARISAERWIERYVDEVRAGHLAAERNSALDVLASYRDMKGRRLDTEVVAVELLNLIRPTAAIAWYVADAAAALHRFPEERAKLVGDGSESYAPLFVEEVRRFYPFTPYLGAIVREPFEWRGHAFHVGTLVLLDVYGANHDPRLWSRPETFQPERFRERTEGAFTYIPQGGGDPNQGHRCAGERVATLLLEQAVGFLARGITYEVDPRQDLTLDLSRMPTRPNSGVVIRNVHPTAALELEPNRAAATAYRDAMNTASFLDSVHQ